MLRRVRMNSENKKIYKGLKTIFILGLILGIVIFVLFLTCNVRMINVEGSSHYSEEEIINKVMMYKYERNTIFLFIKYKFFTTEEIPFIEEIEVNMLNKNKVQIVVYEKTIVGCIEYMSENMYFDKDGIIVEISDTKLENVPYIIGLDFNNVVLHEKLEIDDKNLYLILLSLTQLIKKNEIKVDKISFNRSKEVTLSVGNFKILLGNREVYDEQIAELKNILEKSIDLKSGYLDMRNFKEGQDMIIFKEDN